MSYILKERLWIGVTCLPRKFLSSLVWEWYISVHFWWIMCDVKPHKPSNFAWHSSPAAAPSQQDIKPHKPSNFARHFSPAAAPSLHLLSRMLSPTNPATSPDIPALQLHHPCTSSAGCKAPQTQQLRPTFQPCGCTIPAPPQQDVKPHKPSNFAWHSSPAAAPSLQLVWLCLWNKLKHQMSTGASDDERITVDVWQTCEWMECVDGM